jgi:hypothetical protein
VLTRRRSDNHLHTVPHDGFERLNCIEGGSVKHCKDLTDQFLVERGCLETMGWISMVPLLPPWLLPGVSHPGYARAETRRASIVHQIVLYRDARGT